MSRALGNNWYWENTQGCEAVIRLARSPRANDLALFNLEPHLVQQFAAILGAHCLGLPESGQGYSFERFQEEASWLGLTLEKYPVLYRWDNRSPSTIHAAGGFLPNPATSDFSLWEHMYRENYSGSFISTTVDEHSAHIRTLVSGASRYASAPSLFAGKPVEAVTLYEYRLSGVTGMKTPTAFGFEEENEVVAHRIPSTHIQAYRKVVVNKWTGQLLSETEWLSFSNRTCADYL